MAEYTCDVCKTKFDETEKKLTNDEHKCILHCKKDAFLESNNSEFISNLSKCRIDDRTHIYEFKGVHFPRNLELKYTDLNNSLTNDPMMSFKECTFYNPLIFQIGNFKSTFDECIFYEDWNHYSNNATYNNCSFNNFKYRNENENTTFIKTLKFYNCYFNELNFHNVTFTDEFLIYDSKTKYDKINNIVLTKCILEKKLIFNLNDCDERSLENPLRFTIIKLDLTNSTLRNKVKIQLCDITEANFYNTSFDELADFYKSSFNSIILERTDFKKISVFSEVKFNCDVNFKYTKFLKHSIFRDTVITGYFNLRDSIFDADANFLDITAEERSKNKDNEYIGNPKDIKVANRETARIIKNFYDTSNNIIEANRFYKLEMREREKEIKIYKQPFSWLVFKFHWLSSNHSQNWLFPILWIFIISYLVTSVKTSYGILETILYNFFIYGVLDKMANVINPFSIMTKGETLTFNMLFLKVIIAYLMYQFIVSVRQNTRRK